MFVSNPVNTGCKTSVVYKGDTIELPAPSPDVFDFEDQELEDCEVATSSNTPQIVFPLEFTAPSEQSARPPHNPDEDPDVLEAVEEEPEADLCAIGTGPQPIEEEMEDDVLLKPRCYATFWNVCLRGMRIRHRPEEKFCPTCRKAVELQAEQVDLITMINRGQGFGKWETKQAVEARLRVVERELPEKLQHTKWLAEQRGEVSHVPFVVVDGCSCKLRVV